MVKESYYYKFLRYTLPITLRIFYKKIQVTGTENIPRNTPIIFTPNHQNSLMDALITGIISDRGTFFLARADVFKKKSIADIMYKLRVLPVYRTRDGIDSLSNNNETFDKSVDLLVQNHSVLVFVEGSHNRVRHLRELKKGYARIAFAAAEKSPNNLPVIIPVGINYSGHLYIQTNVVINFGKPIKISDFIELYHEKPAAAMLQLTQKLAPKIRELILSIDDKENYKQIEVIKDININEAKQEGILQRNNFLVQLNKEKEIIAKLAQIKNENLNEYQELISNASEYLTIIDKNDLHDEQICIKKPENKVLLSILSFIIAIPLLLPGYIVNIIPYLIIKKLLKKVKDDHFLATFTFGIGMFLFPIYYLILILVSLIISRNLIFFISVTVGILLSSYCILKLRKIYFNLKNLIVFNNFRKNCKEEYSRIKLLRKKLLF